ncbi:GFA family protein [Aurantivibrio infirmus]
MIESTCHCGAVRIEVSKKPDFVTDCNCSIDRRLGALWAYYKREEIKIIGHPENTDEYIWGEKTLRTVRCRSCGCTTHWEPLEIKSDSIFGVNTRNFERDVVKGIRVRHFDGADTWKFLD